MSIISEGVVSLNIVAVDEHGRRPKDRLKYAGVT